MTPRSIRRAQERKARKEEARKAKKEALLRARQFAREHPAPATEQTFPELDQLTAEEITRPVSQAQLLANRANAQLSTGPKSSSGKAKVSVNAVKTALTGRTVLLPSDDVEDYQHFIAEYTKEFQPATLHERDLLQSICDTVWRLRRIPALEMAIYALGRWEAPADAFFEHGPAQRDNLIDLDTYRKYEKQLRNLHLQEARLRRRYEKETAEYRQLQKQRIQQEQEDLAAAAKLYLSAQRHNHPFDPAQFGFEFSTRDVEQYLARQPAANTPHPTLKNDALEAQAA